MNENYVCVKVDREERPDVDAIYMDAVQAMTGTGGWPLNVFVTPDQLPVYGGTYFPPEPRPGMPSWSQVLAAIAETWRERRDELLSGGELLRRRLAGGALLEPAAGPDAAALDGAVAKLSGQFDPRHGGFGGAPKFPQAPVVEFLLASGEREIALATLRAIARGGIHDQLAGGFARYSVDAAWQVPHFEKMIYDNALVARAMLHGWQASGEELLLEGCRGALDWALAEMHDAAGGFYSSLDADSEGVEGRYYVWTTAELHELLGADAPGCDRMVRGERRGQLCGPAPPRAGAECPPGPRPATGRRDARADPRRAARRARAGARARRGTRSA